MVSPSEACCIASWMVMTGQDEHTVIVFDHTLVVDNNAVKKKNMKCLFFKMKLKFISTKSCSCEMIKKVEITDFNKVSRIEIYKTEPL